MCWTTSTSATTTPSTSRTNPRTWKSCDAGFEKHEGVPPLNPPRDGKKLLVLDIDYTLFDHRSTAEHPLELMRPYLHEFLTRAYEHYDIAIWSATGMSWIELKMKELGVLAHPDYKIMQLVDSGAMISVAMEPYGMFKCKPLGWVWAKYGGRYGEKEHDHVRRPAPELRDEPFVRSEDSPVPKGAPEPRRRRRARRADRVPARDQGCGGLHHAQALEVGKVPRAEAGAKRE
jgi:hypothetical protein